MATNEKVILLVEDNPDDVDLTVRALKKNNISNRIEIARDGEQAIEYFKNEKNPMPVVVLLDIKLPKIDGHEVLEYIRNDLRCKMLPVVMLTSSNEESDMIKSYSSGANSYIRKPVDFDRFLEAVKQLGLYWLVLNENPYK